MNRLLRSSWGRFLVAVFLILLTVAVAANRLLPKPSRTAFSTPTATPQNFPSPSSGTAPTNLPSFVSTQVAASLTYVALATPTPWPTPIQNLALLVGQADAIAQAKIVGTNGAMHSFMYSLAVEKWLKKPGNVLTNTGILWVPNPWEHIPSYGFMDFRDLQADRGDRFVLFMTANVGNTFHDSPDYYLVGSASGFFDSGFFRIAGGKIDWGGIATYDQWPVGKFEDEITNLQMRTSNP